jgi:hypothetical protein
MKNVKIGKVAALDLIKNSNGKVFGVKFTKKDGSIREMCARLKVKKNLKGVGMKFNPKELGYVTAFDMNAKDKRGGTGDYRLININTLMHLSLEGKEYEVK